MPLLTCLNNFLSFLSVPESVRASLPALKHRGKRSSKGKGRKSEQSSINRPVLPPTGQEDSMVMQNAEEEVLCSCQNDERMKSDLSFSSNQTEPNLEQLMQGFASLDITQTSTVHTPATSTPVGGARPKVRLSPEVTCDGEVKAESGEVTPEKSQSAEAAAVAVSEPVDSRDVAKGGAGAEPETEGACGWSKTQASLELTCGGQTDVRKYDFISFCDQEY